MAPKEQPPRKLSGKRTVEPVTGLWKVRVVLPVNITLSAEEVTLSGTSDRGGTSEHQR
jgi:hypothetical protein